MKSNKTNEVTEGIFKEYFSVVADYVKSKYLYLIVFFSGLILVSVLNFLKISTVQSVASFSIDDYEVGQISDKTIIAEKDLPAEINDNVFIVKGEKIIKKGFVITEEGYEKLKKMAASPIYIDYRAFANAELFLILLGIMWYLLFSFISFGRNVQIKECVLNLIFFLLVYTMTAFGGKLSVFSNAYSICIIVPASLCIMLVSILYGNISATLMSFIISLGVFQAVGFQVPTLVFLLETCLTSSLIVRKIERRIDLVIASLMLAVLNAVFLVLDFVIFNEPFGDKFTVFLGIAANGFFSGILALSFLTPLEIILNTASVFRLMDLSNIENSPVISKMKVAANGTYNHSIMVAELAENACKAVGANSLLARVAAYYHDIGKIDQSEYFTENQEGENKHNDLNPTLSVSIIRSHVKKGVEKAHEMHLPQPVIDIIAEHHGNNVISYFYNEAKAKDPTLTPETFTYHGNPPSTRESAIVMLADTVEAACRSLDNPTVPRIEKFITVLFNGKMEQKQLDNCDLTFRDLAKIREAFLPILGGFYHNRIKYQNQKDPDENETAGKQESKETKTEAKAEVKTEIKTQTKSESK